jgi:hypothetical protein
MRAQLDMNVIIALLDSGHVMHASACGHPSHAFWPQQINLLQEGLMRWERILGPRARSPMPICRLWPWPMADCW